MGPRPNGESYEINLTLIGMQRSKQFVGGGTENPYQHFALFDDICGTFKLNAFTYDEIKLKLFPMSIIYREEIIWSEVHDLQLQTKTR
jgi:hypothetical protein